MRNYKQLPVNWFIAPIEELLEPLANKKVINQGWSPRCEKGPSSSEEEWGALKTTAIQPGAFLPEHNKKLPVALEPRPQLEVQAGDLLLTCAGPRNRCGIACLVRSTRKHLMISGKMYRFRPKSELLDAKFLESYLQTLEAQEAIDKMKTGGNESGLNLTHSRFRKLLVPVAPIGQQKRIVAEIEKQFSRLDEAVANLKRVKANLKRYKAAVLKAAVEGKLTEEWRKQHPDVEPADKLLERILVERREKWQGRGKYKEPAAPDTTDLPELPGGWVWVTLPQLGELNRGKSKHRPRNDSKLFGGDYPFVQTGDVRHAVGEIKSYTQTYSEAGLAQSRLWPKGTLCITIAANIADTALLGFDACFPDSVVGFLPETDHTNIRFVEYFIRTAKENLERFAPATAQKNINLQILKAVAVPFPSESEQNAIVFEIESRLSVVEKIESALNFEIARSDRLRQSILKKAFSRQLV